MAINANRPAFDWGDDITEIKWNLETFGDKWIRHYVSYTDKMKSRNEPPLSEKEWLEQVKAEAEAAIDNAYEDWEFNACMARDYLDSSFKEAEEESNGSGFIEDHDENEMVVA